MRKHFILILILIATFSFAQKEPNLSKYKTQKEKLQAWAEYCDEYLSIENYKQLRVVGKKGIKMTAQNDYYNQSLFFFYTGISFDYGSETDSISYYLEKSEEFGRKAKNNRRIIEALRQMLVCYKNYGSTFKRERVLNELQKVIDTSKNELDKSKILSEISDYYISLGQYEKGLQYKINGLKGRKKYLSKADYNDSINYGVQLVNISELYVTMQNFPKSLEYLIESEPYLVKYKEGIAAVHKDFIAIYLKQNDLKKTEERYSKFKSFLKTVDLGDCYEYFIDSNLLFSDYYLDRKQNAKALEYANYANTFVQKYASNFTKAQVNQMFGKIYLQQKKYKNALPFLKLAEPIIKEDSPEANSTLQKLLADTYEGLGNKSLAYYHLSNYNKLQENLLAEKAKKNLAEMEAKYQNNAKKQEIKNKNLQIDTAKKQKYYFIAGILLLAIIGSLLFYQSRNRKKVNQKLSFLNKELDESNKAKTRFFSILNHDLRGPVANLVFFLQLQKESPEMLDEESIKRMQDKTMAGAENLLNSMEDILQWSKSQMENFKPQPKKTAVNSLFDDVKNHFSSEEKVQISFENIQNIQINTDENYLKTIIRNLTGNAVKALIEIENPTIIWKAWQENNQSYLSISDNGKGASDEQFKALYDDKEVVGIKTGLGLHLIRDLAKAIDCEILVDSKINQGTTFTLKLK
ncbi:HAMP domain-containing sensor histidine kinase [Flavobacterium sp. SUN052]|uniref:tetratricopeptide repeat-containing sensor histidine kinase n=1 Tax=Flavobacterium sp. SUN052 TaxID=3002441 RepID=UPI00237DB97D|nr:HAMP domain-containing sensor histidine kinase [Flavobacterium sp. SUN052]MEC4004019.1 HAMP domain-containing sensor histidine kinase [Flavobacterium sp. SUN052]